METLQDSKACTTCGKTKPLEDFYKQKAGKYGRTAACKKCTYARKRVHEGKNKEAVAARQKAYYEANKEACAAQKKAYYEANKEAVAARQKAYREANKEAIAAREKAYREANREAIAAYLKAYREAPRGREIIRAKNNKRKARLRGAMQVDTPLTTDQWLTLLEAHNNACARCGSTDSIHLDHIVPISKGGKHTLDNVQPLCAYHNLSKSNREDTDYRTCPLDGCVCS